MKLSKFVIVSALVAALSSNAVSVFASDNDAVQDVDTNHVIETQEQAKELEKQAKELEKQADKIKVKINDGEVDFTKYDSVFPYIENDTTLIPIRAIAEGLGLDVSWDGNTQKVIIEGRVKISFAIDSDTVEVNGESVKIDVPAHIVDDRTFVPLRFISERMDADVEWDEATRTIDIKERRGTPGNGNHVGMPGGGQTAKETDPAVLAVIEEGSEKFEQFTFNDEETGIALEYSLYIPEDYDENEKYPFIMYIPDSSGASKSAKEIVEQYYGADIWVSAEEQAKHKSFVLVPAYSEVVVDDDWNTSEQIEVTVRLINYLTETYSIDTDRLYTTGQSMGCMTSLYLNSKYPDLFAASLFVSGQWDISVLKGLEDKSFFYIVAGGDDKASGGQNEVMAMFDADGVEYSYGTWSAQNSIDEQNSSVSELLSQGHKANMICFEKGSVIKEGETGMEHASSFNYGYKIPAVRDWLFEQSKK